MVALPRHAAGVAAPRRAERRLGLGRGRRGERYRRHGGRGEGGGKGSERIKENINTKHMNYIDEILKR